MGKWLDLCAGYLQGLLRWLCWRSRLAQILSRHFAHNGAIGQLHAPSRLLAVVTARPVAQDALHPIAIEAANFYRNRQSPRLPMRRLPSG